MPSRQAKLQEDTNFRVMRILQENPDLTQREIAEKLGVSVGGLNYCLKALMGKGWVKMQNFSQSDLLPISRTSVKVVKSVNQENDGHEEEQIQ